MLAFGVVPFFKKKGVLQEVKYVRVRLPVLVAYGVLLIVRVRVPVLVLVLVPVLVRCFHSNKTNDKYSIVRVRMCEYEYCYFIIVTHAVTHAIASIVLA